MARGGGDSNQVVYVDGDVPQLPIQLGQLLVDQSKIGPGQTNLQQCTSQDPLVYEPVQGGFPVYLVDNYQINTVPGTTNMYPGFAAAVAAANAGGGGTVTCLPGSTYRLESELIVLEGVYIDLNRSTTNHYFGNNTSDAAYRLRDYTGVRNGTINVIGSGTPVAGRDAWTCVIAGESGALIAGYTELRISDLTLSSNRNDSFGGQGVLLQAECSNVIVENIYCPTSSTLGNAVRVAWAGDGVTPTPATQHPRNVAIRNIRLGTMTKATSSFDIAAIDILGAFNVSVENVYADRWSGDAVVQVRAGGQGDVGAPAAVKPLLFKGVSVKNVECKQCDSHGLIINGKANDASGTPSNSQPVLVQNCSFIGSGSGNTASGIRVLNSFDVLIENCFAQEFDRGLYIEENAKRTTVRKSIFKLNNEDGVVVAHGTAPEDTILDQVESYMNGADGGSRAGFYIETATRTQIINCIAGDATSETNQLYGFRVLSSTPNTLFRGRNRVRNIKGGGTKYLFADAVLGDIKFNGGSNAALATGATEFVPLGSCGTPGAAEANASVLTDADMVVTNLQCKVTAAPTGATKTRTFTVIDDGAGTALAATVTDAQTTASDYDAVEVAAGSYLSIQSSVANTPAAAFGKWSAEAFLT